MELIIGSYVKLQGVLHEVRKNNSVEFKVNSVIMVNEPPEPLTILEEVVMKGYNHSFIVTFNGYDLQKATLKSLRKRSVKNFNSPCIYDVGYYGYGDYKAKVDGLHTKEYMTWRSMFYRCYSEVFYKRCQTYADCVVNKRWHNYQTFCKDVVHILGYDKWKNSGEEYHLDKDVFSTAIKEYSPETCQFITRSENIGESNHRWKPIQNR